MKHKYILKCFDVYGTNNNVYIVTEFCNSDLKRLVKRHQRLPELAAIKCMKKII